MHVLSASFLKDRIQVKCRTTSAALTVFCSSTVRLRYRRLGKGHPHVFLSQKWRSAPVQVDVCSDTTLPRKAAHQKCRSATSTSNRRRNPRFHIKCRHAKEPIQESNSASATLRGSRRAAGCSEAIFAVCSVLECKAAKSESWILFLGCLNGSELHKSKRSSGGEAISCVILVCTSHHNIL